jgi:hypothetical protein
MEKISLFDSLMRVLWLTGQQRVLDLLSAEHLRNLDMNFRLLQPPEGKARPGKGYGLRGVQYLLSLQDSSVKSSPAPSTTSSPTSLLPCPCPACSKAAQSPCAQAVELILMGNRSPLGIDRGVSSNWQGR